MKHSYLLFVTIVLVFLSSTGIEAQTCVVHGKVTDEQTNEPLPFVNIGIKGLPTGTFSDSHGLYQLEISRGDTVLIFSCVGYDKQEKHIKVDGRNRFFLEIQMTPVSQELSTLVVSGSKY